MYRLSCILLVLLPILIQASPWDEDSIKTIFSGKKLEPVEGVWRFPRDGATVLVNKVSADGFDIIVLDSPHLSMRPGTKIGEMYSTAKRGYYDGHLDTSQLGGKMKLKSANIVFNVNDDGNLVLNPYRQGYSISLKRFIYRIFKISVVEHNERPKGLDGASRIYPATPKLPICL